MKIQDVQNLIERLDENESFVWVAEYNPTHKQYHIDTLENSLKTNCKLMLDKNCHTSCAWVPLFIGSANECRTFLDSYKSMQF